MRNVDSRIQKENGGKGERERRKEALKRKTKSFTIGESRSCRRSV